MKGRKGYIFIATNTLTALNNETSENVKKHNITA
jgi:hypothetical protein